jgi:phytoene dehydrogenase-like protein
MKKIVIVGGGIAGLSAGIQARKFGFDTVLCERHSVVGGQCTGWDRAGYHIDGCIHWLTGTKPGSELNDWWRETGALAAGVKIIQLDNFGVWEGFGQTITLWKDLDRLERELVALSPEDARHIRELIKAVRAVQSMPVPAKLPVDMLPIRELLKLLVSMKGAGAVMNRFGKLTCPEYAERYKNPALRAFFASRMPDGWSFSSFVFSLGTFSSGNGAIPEGGSRAMALRMADTFRSLGGRIETGKDAAEIVVENGRATAVRFADGTAESADYVIAACDPRVTFDRLLGGNYRDRAFELRYADQKNYSVPSSVQVAIGVAADMTGYPRSFSFVTDPWACGPVTLHGMGFKNFAYEPAFAPAGHTVLTSSISQMGDSYGYWEKLYQDKAAYRAEKARIGAILVAGLERRFPELAGKLTVLDVATPATYNRYTGAWHGAWMAFGITPKSKSMMHSGKIKGLPNCLLAGQWLMPPGGLPCAAITGRFSAQRIARMEKLI